MMSWKNYIVHCWDHFVGNVKISHQRKLVKLSSVASMSHKLALYILLCGVFTPRSAQLFKSNFAKG